MSNVLTIGHTVVAEKQATETVTVRTPAIHTIECSGYLVAMLYRGHLVRRMSNWTSGGKESALDNARCTAHNFEVTKHFDEPMVIVVLKHVAHYEAEYLGTQVNAYRGMVEEHMYGASKNHRLHSWELVWASNGITVLNLDKAVAENLFQDYC